MMPSITIKAVLLPDIFNDIGPPQAEETFVIVPATPPAVISYQLLCPFRSASALTSQDIDTIQDIKTISRVFPSAKSTGNNFNTAVGSTRTLLWAYCPVKKKNSSDSSRGGPGWNC
jgi:hypothetical protein